MIALAFFSATLGRQRVPAGQFVQYLTACRSIHGRNKVENCWDHAARVAELDRAIASGDLPLTPHIRNIPSKQEKARINGTVVPTAVVGTDGLAHDISVVKPLGYGLDEEAGKAVKKWRFKPGKGSGKPAPVEIHVEVQFRYPYPTPLYRPFQPREAAHEGISHGERRSEEKQADTCRAIRVVFVSDAIGAIGVRCLDARADRRMELNCNFQRLRSPFRRHRTGGHFSAGWAQFWAQRVAGGCRSEWRQAAKSRRYV